MNKLTLVCFISALAGLTQNSGAVPAAFGDLILGFKAAGGEGSAVNLEVNLGPATQFSGAAAGSTMVLSGLSVDDLKATYGDDWNTRTDLTWGIVGTTGAGAIGTVPARTIWASRAAATPGIKSTPWTRDIALTQQSSSNTIATMYTGAPGSIDRFGATPNSTTASKVGNDIEGSFTVQDDATPNVSFRRFNPTVTRPIAPFPGTASSYDGTPYGVLDLWEMRPGTSGTPGTFVGSVGLNSAGKLVFSKDETKFGSTVTPPVVLGEPAISRNTTSGAITVSLGGVPAGSYILQRSPSMADGSWADLSTKAPTGDAVSFDDPAPPSPRAYYRIKKAS
jgi:hypothetical protein